MRRLFTLTVILSTCSLLAQARLAREQENSQKQPWQFTLEERIALRTNLELARERVRAARDEKRLAVHAAHETRLPVDSYTGKTHPELFLPHEVFRSLMALAFEGSQRAASA